MIDSLPINIDQVGITTNMSVGSSVGATVAFSEQNWQSFMEIISSII